MPARENSDYALEVAWDGSFTTANTAYTPGGTVDFKVGNDGSFHGFTLEDTQATVGVKLVPKEGGEAVFYPSATFDFPSHYGEYETKTYNQFTIPVSAFPKAGEFIVTPAYEYKGAVKDVAVRVGVSKSFIMICSSRGVKFEAADASRTLSAYNVKIEQKLYSGKTCTIKAEIHNSGEEYLGLIKAGFENAEGQVRTWLDPVPVNLADGETVTVSFTGILNSYNTTLDPGTYTFNIFNEEGESICANPVEVNVLEVPSGRPVIDVSFEIPDCSEGDGTTTSPYLIGDEIDVEVKVSVSSGVFDDIIALYAFYDDTSSVEFSENSVSNKSFFVAPGESQKYIYHLGTSDFDMNRLAYIRAYGWKNDWSGESFGWLGRQVYVKRTSSGISSIHAGKSKLSPNPAVDFTTVESSSAIRNIEVYSISGIKMLEISGNGEESQNIDVSNLPSGHYIVMVNSDGSVERHRLLKR